MDKVRETAKDTVRRRAGNTCEKCGVSLTRNRNGKPTDRASRTTHHRRPRRLRGRDSVTCMVLLCITCHKWIHANEEIAALDGWIVTGDPAKRPYNSHRGWVLPLLDGTLVPINFETGRVDPVSIPSRPSRSRNRRQRARLDHRRGLSRKVA